MRRPPCAPPRARSCGASRAMISTSAARYRLARRGERRARRLVEPDPARLGDGACRRDLSDRLSGQRAAQGLRRSRRHTAMALILSPPMSCASGDERRAHPHPRWRALLSDPPTWTAWPSIAPAVNASAPGGVTLAEARQSDPRASAQGRVVGMDIIEHAQARCERDHLPTAGWLIVSLIGRAIRAGLFRTWQGALARGLP
jgi:hypothetical protein